jgi:hypothetical protein
MHSALHGPQEINHVELAILSKWLIQETWFSISQVLKQRLSNHQITLEKKGKLEKMYSDFYRQAFYSPVLIKADTNRVLQDARKMLSMLKELDENAWITFMLHHRLV